MSSPATSQVTCCCTCPPQGCSGDCLFVGLTVTATGSITWENTSDFCDCNADTGGCLPPRPACPPVGGGPYGENFEASGSGSMTYAVQAPMEYILKANDPEIPFPGQGISNSARRVHSCRVDPSDPYAADNISGNIEVSGSVSGTFTATRNGVDRESNSATWSATFETATDNENAVITGNDILGPPDGLVTAMSYLRYTGAEAECLGFGSTEECVPAGCRVALQNGYPFGLSGTNAFANGLSVLVKVTYTLSSSRYKATAPSECPGGDFIEEYNDQFNGTEISYHLLRLASSAIYPDVNQNYSVCDSTLDPTTLVLCNGRVMSIFDFFNEFNQQRRVPDQSNQEGYTELVDSMGVGYDRSGGMTPDEDTPCDNNPRDLETASVAFSDIATGNCVPGSSVIINRNYSTNGTATYRYDIAESRIQTIACP